MPKEWAVNRTGVLELEQIGVFSEDLRVELQALRSFSGSCDSREQNSQKGSTLQRQAVPADPVEGKRVNGSSLGDVVDKAVPGSPYRGLCKPKA